MNSTRGAPLRILVAVASYGTANDQYLKRLIHEYRSMTFDVHIIVLSNLEKPLDEGVELQIGLPTKDPWSLPFGHKKIFADRSDAFDLFVYSEDDILISEDNLRSFLDVSKVLPEDEIAGFIRVEHDSKGNANYPEMHAHFHWDPTSPRTVANYTLAFFSNEHAGCYVLTRNQLKKAIASGGFLLAPHQEKYDLLCSAATDLYTRCGYRKMIPISHIDNFTVAHLPNKYVGKFGVSGLAMRKQVDALLQLACQNKKASPLFPTETKLRQGVYSKDYYEPFDPAIVSVIPDAVRRILSIGCGMGALESGLAEAGRHVVALPLDPVVGECVSARGVEILTGGLRQARERLAGRKFDCLLFVNVLHLIPRPVEVLSMFKDVLSENAVVVIKSPNMTSLPVLARALRTPKNLYKLRNYETAGAHLMSVSRVRAWCRNAGWTIETVKHLPSGISNASESTLAGAHHFVTMARRQ